MVKDKWADPMKIVDCEMGAKRHEDCPCRGRLFKARRIEPKHGAFAFVRLNEQDPHFMKVRLDEVPIEEVVRVFFTRGLLAAITCPDCQTPYTHVKERYYCENCWTKIISEEFMDEAVIEELDKLVPGAICASEFRVWMERSGDKAVTFVLFA